MTDDSSPSSPAPKPERTLVEVGASRLDDERGDIANSYSADRIASGQPVRKPFQHEGCLWICTSISGSGLTSSGSTEFEAYRLTPEKLFAGTATTYTARTGTAEAAESARNDPNGFYHGMRVKFAGAASVLCGPPARFIAAQRNDPNRPAEPEQLVLF